MNNYEVNRVLDQYEKMKKYSENMEITSLWKKIREIQLVELVLCDDKYLFQVVEINGGF